MIHVVSLGAGVQSTTMVLMAARGLIAPMPECAIFADTGAEPASVYRHLEWLTSGVLPFPVHVVSRGNLRDAILESTNGNSNRGSDARPPFFVKNHNGSLGVLNRQCTHRFKIIPIHKEIRRLLGLKRGQHWPKEQRVAQWVGISTDEASRMKDSGIPAVVNRWPLIEMGISRKKCLAWLESNGFPTPPKSACTFCPYRRDGQWRQLRDTDPEGWADAVRIDNAIRNGMKPGRDSDGKLFVHDSLAPLEEVDLRTNAEKGLPEPAYQINLFENECEGMCGV